MLFAKSLLLLLLPGTRSDNENMNVVLPNAYTRHGMTGPPGLNLGSGDKMATYRMSLINSPAEIATDGRGMLVGMNGNFSEFLYADLNGNES